MTQHLQTMMCEYTTLIIMLYIGVRCLNQRNNKIIRLFSHFVFGVIAFQIINIPVRMVDAGLVRMPAAVVFVLNCGFMIAETFVTYEWFYFFENIQNSLFVEKKIIRALRSIPLVLMIVLCVVSWWTGWLFYVDDTGMYRRGVLFALQVVLPYTYVFVTLVSAIAYSITRREKSSAWRISERLRSLRLSRRPTTIWRMPWIWRIRLTTPRRCSSTPCLMI